MKRHKLPLLIVAGIALVFLLFAFVIPLQSKSGGYISCMPGQDAACQVASAACGSLNNPSHSAIAPRNPTYKYYHILLGQKPAYQKFTSHVYQEYADGCYEEDVHVGLYL